LTNFLSDQGLIDASGPTASSLNGQNQGNVYQNCCQCLYLYVASVHIQVSGIWNMYIKRFCFVLPSQEYI